LYLVEVCVAWNIEHGTQINWDSRLLRLREASAKQDRLAGVRLKHFTPLLNPCLPAGRLSPEEGEDFSPSHFRGRGQGMG